MAMSPDPFFLHAPNNKTVKGRLYQKVVWVDLYAQVSYNIIVLSGMYKEIVYSQSVSTHF